MKNKRIVVTGGPGTGKTVLISSLEEHGFHCFHEVIRTMTLDALDGKEVDDQLVNPIDFVDDAKSFNDQLINARLKHFKEGEVIQMPHLFYDRGLPDVIAYMNYFKQPIEPYYSNLCSRHRYDEVLILPPWEDIYVQDNERMENFEQACGIHAHLDQTYTALGYQPIEVPFGTIEERLQFVIDHLEKTG
ncbi:Predicted ATPase [Maribacter sedimenticola]|uniref:Predicted ATPase n=1 Tax=Maribacter sedimenticola TaxID=228956 RepID=A0ABY1SH83_9FLAO|nr:ATP-binding protein [Maribacter sedimenticola]SNR48715.1 Predicted ATPase [Maribacter sedimenticola]